jgi:RNA polymerase sigma factor (sigma-70 family)
VVAPLDKDDLFNQILARNKGRFIFIARQYASTDEIMDLYQEIVSQIWKSLDKFEGRSTPATWAYSVALNTASTYRRNNFRRERAWRAYRKNALSEQIGGRAEEQMGGRAEEQILLEFVRSLPDLEVPGVRPG